MTVTRVIDGDTIEARFPNGDTDTLRLLGVDTPETTLSNVSPEEFEGIPDTTAGRDHLFNWGERATAFADERLEGERVRVEVDPQADRRGSFGRLLVYVHVDGGSFNEQLLSNGYARVYESDFSKLETYLDLEEQARQSEIGLWNFEVEDPTPTPTAENDDSTATPAEQSNDDIPPPPDDGDYDCGHFETWDQAQTVLERDEDDPHGLDADDDGVACEGLKGG